MSDPKGRMDGAPSHNGPIRKAAVAGVVALGAILLGAADPPDPSAAMTVLRRCVVEYEDDTAVGSPTSGVLGECLVRPGDRVKAGQVLGRLRDDDIKAEVRLREAAAQNDVEVRLATAKSALALTKAERTLSLMKRGTVSREENAAHRLESDVAAIEVEQARQRYRLAGLQLEQTRAMLQTRELVSPHDGVVVAVLRRKAEPVAVRDEIFRVVDPNRLRVVGLVDVSEAWKVKAGQTARVIPEVAGADLPIEREVFEGKVTFVDNRVEAATRSCKVHILAANRAGMLRAGIEARIEIDTEGGVVDPDAGRAPAKK